MKRKILLNIYFLICSISLLAQGELINHQKYWYYKTRLHNDFMKMGLYEGESIPFNERGLQDVTSNYDYNDISTDARSLRVGDATARLGIYLSALATEYKLLKNNGQNLSNIKHEIFCALNAINRLDYKGEYILSLGYVGAFGMLNGFFVRDDIPEYFLMNNYEHFNYYAPQRTQNGISTNHLLDKGFTQTFTHGMEYTSSSRSRFEANANNDPWNQRLKGTEESQDQVYYLLMGLALTKELVSSGETDNGAVFGYGANGSDLKQQAIDISDRIIKHISNDPTFTIRNPANFYNFNAPVQTGAQVAFASYALDNAGCFIKYNGVNNDYSSNDMPNYYFGQQNNASIPSNACTDYRNATSQLTASTWMVQALSNFSGNLNNSGIFQTLASVCNCIYESALTKDLNIQNQIDNLNTAIDQAWAAYDNYVSHLLTLAPGWVQNAWNYFSNAINNELNTVTQYTSYLGGLVQQLANSLYPSYKINTTDYHLNYCSSQAAITYVDCNGNTNSHTGTDFIFPVYVRDILHQNNSNPGIPWYVQLLNFNATPGHTQLKLHLENVLNTAPCQGNSRLFPNIPAPNWGASNRCDLTDNLWTPTCAKGNQGEYAGTDYMLLHNLYYLREGYNIGMMDYSDRKVSLSLPIGNDFTAMNKRTIGAFEYIDANNVLNSNSAATYRAGKEIALNADPTNPTGFSVVNGADFEAIIAPFPGTCSNGDMYRSDSNSSNGDFYEGATDFASKPKHNLYSSSAENPDMVLTGLPPNIIKQMDSLRAGLNANVIPLLNKVEVFPNPNSGEFNVEFNLTSEDNVNVKILNVLGQEIFSHNNITGYVKLPFDLKAYSKGVYIVQIKQSNGVEFIKRVTIQ